METKQKSVIIIAATFLLGLILGTVLHSAIMYNRFRKRADMMMTGPGFQHRIEQMLDLSDEQREKISVILDTHFRAMEANRERFKAIIDSLENDLLPLLTDDQRKILKQRIQPEQGRRFPPPFDRPGPPDFPGNPPPEPPDREWRDGPPPRHP